MEEASQRLEGFDARIAACKAAVEKHRVSLGESVQRLHGLGSQLDSRSTEMLGRVQAGQVQLRSSADRVVKGLSTGAVGSSPAQGRQSAAQAGTAAAGLGASSMAGGAASAAMSAAAAAGSAASSTAAGGPSASSGGIGQCADTGGAGASEAGYRAPGNARRPPESTWQNIPKYKASGGPTVAGMLERARSMLGQGVAYGRGGGRFGDAPGPWVPGEAKVADCTGFISWVLGIDRSQGEKSEFGKELSSDSIFTDAKHLGKWFEQKTEAKPGDLIVYPDYTTKERTTAEELAKTGKKYVNRKHQGHIAMVTAVDDQGVPRTAIDCSKLFNGVAEHAVDWKHWMEHSAVIAKVKLAKR